jgi:hypothetical protein
MPPRRSEEEEPPSTASTTVAQIVGQYSESSCHGFLLDGDTFTTIDDPDALFATGAADINDRGQIVGFYDGMTGIGQCASQGASTSASDSGSAAEQR